MDSVHGDGPGRAGRWHNVKQYSHLWIIACLLGLAACSGKPAQPLQAQASSTPRLAPAPQSSRAERSRTTQVSIVVVGHGRTLYRILADSNDSRRASNGTYTSHFTNPSIIFFNADGGQMRATARTADADGASKVVTLHDDAHVVSTDGSILTCDAFSYDETHNHVHGWGHVVVHTKQGDTLHGGNLTGDVRLRSVHIDG
jgi:LPS export ABC transporter protein LptC